MQKQTNNTATKSREVSSISPLLTFTPQEFIAKVFQETGRRLWMPEMVESPEAHGIPEEETAPLKTALTWMKSFIIKSHPEYGLTKAVCPFVKPSMDVGLIYLSVLALDNPESLEEIQREMNVYRDIFVSIPPLPDHLALLRSLVLILPHSSPQVVDQLLESDASDSLKTDWLRKGIMMGQFYSSCPFRSTINRKLKTHQSPIPFYAIRPFIESDWKFVRKNPLWREIYRERFGEPGFPYRHRSLYMLYTGFLKAIRPFNPFK